MRRCVIATSKKSKPSTPAAEPKSIVDELSELVWDSSAFRKVWYPLDKIRKIAVALVLWDNSAYLTKVGVETSGSLKEMMDSARPLIGSEWCAAVMTVRSNRRLWWLKDAVEQVERHEVPIGELPRLSQRDVALVFSPDNHYETLDIDDDLKEAIKSLKESRAKWAEFYGRWEMPKPLQWEVTDVLEYINNDSPTAFNAVEKAARNKDSKAQIQLAKQLQETRNKLLQIPTRQYKGPRSDIAKLCRLSEAISSELQIEGESSKQSAQWRGLEFRGGMNNQRMAVIKALAPIYTELKGRPAGAGWNPIAQDRQTEFVRFVHDFIETAGHPDWADGLEFAVSRCLRKVRSKKT